VYCPKEMGASLMTWSATVTLEMRYSVADGADGGDRGGDRRRGDVYDEDSVDVCDVELECLTRRLIFQSISRKTSS
jgi:hypothetical protein